MVEPAGEQKVLCIQSSLLDPDLRCVACNSRDLELDWPFGFMLHYDSSRSYLITMRHVTDLECNKVASAKLAVNTKVKECKLPDPTLHLKAYAQSPDILHLEGRLLPDDLAFVPRLMMRDVVWVFHDGLPSS